MKILYQYTVKILNNGKTVLVEGPKGTRLKEIGQSADEQPQIAADLLRDLAKAALEQAEIVEGLDAGVPAPGRDLNCRYRAELVAIKEP